MPASAKLAFVEDWSSGQIDPTKWYMLRKKWGAGNHGVVPENVFLAKDTVDGKEQHVLVCRGHGDQYQGAIVGLHGNAQRVGGVIVSKPYFASGRFEVVMKIGKTSHTAGNPKDPRRPIGMIPAIWTYAYRWVQAGKQSDPHAFSKDNPMYNPHLNHRGWKSNEYWSEIDFPEFGKNQDLETGLYNGFVNKSHQSLTFDTKAAIDGQFHTFTTIWRTHLVPIPGVTDQQVTSYNGYWWIQDKRIPFKQYLGNPLKRLGKDQYSIYSGKVATHFIDGQYVGSNHKFVPSMAAQLNIGVWFPKWAGAAPWKQSTISVASVKIWQFDDPGDVRGILTEDITNNMDKQGKPLQP